MRKISKKNYIKVLMKSFITVQTNYYSEFETFNEINITSQKQLKSLFYYLSSVLNYHTNKLKILNIMFKHV